MTKRLLDNKKPEQEIVVLFANTGQEDEKTLEFVNNCDKHFGFNTVWLEAEVDPTQGKGTRHRVVTFETASREGRPYEDVIKKFGIANKVSPHCTRELKQRPITSYVRSLGWKNGDYETAIGIRIDEIDRMNAKAKEANIVYPLVSWKVAKPEILDWWVTQPFDLDLPEHRGNCLWCWKKSNRKLFTLVYEDRSLFNFPNRMEEQYGLCGAVANKNGRPMNFFRGDKNTKELVYEALTTDFKTFVDQRYLDLSGGCEDSCEVFSSEQDVEELLREIE
jgi:hypothetical protein